jgi:hypothetical protein
MAGDATNLLPILSDDMRAVGVEPTRPWKVGGF